jgi:uncharacterized protein with HEPN domain
MDVGNFVSNRQPIYAVTRALEILSEASRRAAGNVYRHE